MMSADELKEKLLDVGVQAALSMTSAKELRALAEESVRLQNLRAEKDRAQRKKKKEEHDDEVMKKGGPMAELMADKPGWEIEEWDPVTESEMMERLARLPMYKAMSGDMLDKIITGMRKNPKLIDYLEQESKSTKMMMQM